MGINIRTKGAGGEREVATDLNAVVILVCQKMDIPVPSPLPVQRNQNQTAIGGHDLVGAFGLAIEVKRQETLSINTWWAQCVASAERTKEIPVLIFRQSKQKWRVITVAHLLLPDSTAANYAHMQMRAEISYEDFKAYFRELVGRHYYEQIIKNV